MLLGGQGFWILIVVLFIWISALTFWLTRTVGHYTNLVKRGKSEDLKSILETLLKRQDQVEQNLQNTKNIISGFEKKSLVNIQKVGVVKFNPYSEAGGNHSFALCLLDGNENGFIVLSLHSRDDTRLYLKEVKRGAAEYELSKEEMLALARAKSERSK